MVGKGEDYRTEDILFYLLLLNHRTPSLPISRSLKPCPLSANDLCSMSNRTPSIFLGSWIGLAPLLYALFEVTFLLKY